MRKIEAVLLICIVVAAGVGVGGGYYYGHSTGYNAGYDKGFEEGVPFAPPGAPTEIKIGILAPLTGSVADHGQYMVEGVKLAVTEINERGGIFGREIELYVEDHADTPDVGIAGINKLIFDYKVDFIVGVYWSGVAHAVGPIAAENEKILIFNVASSNPAMEPVLTDYEDNKYLFRIGVNHTECGIQSAYWVSEVAKAQNYFFIGPDLFWVHESHTYMQEKLAEIAPGVTLLGELYPPLGTTDFSSELLTIKGANPDAVYTYFTGGDGPTFLKQYKSDPALAKIPISYEWFFATVEDIEACESAMPGSTDYVCAGIAGWYTAFPSERAKHYVEAYYDEYGYYPDMTHTSRGYDSIYVIKDAIERAMSFDVDDVVTAMEETDYMGASGRIVFNAAHHAPNGPGYLAMTTLQFIDETGYVIWPPEVATGEYIPPPS